MLLGQFFLLSFIIFSFLFVMSLVRRDGKAIRNLVIAGISFIVFFVIVSPDNDENKTIKEDDPIKIETNEDDIEEINENKELTQAEGPIPDPITYDGSGDDVIDIEKLKKVRLCYL